MPNQSYASDGTPILQWDNALSYVCYFIFVWWIWIAQVAYNMRFRQADWLHRIWVFAQLVVFSALAAFTKDFDIAIGFSPDDPLLEQVQAQLGTDQSSLDASNFREQRLPRLNARGVSIVMGCSRLLLLMQYIVGTQFMVIRDFTTNSPFVSSVFYHARNTKRKSLLTHMVPLVFSSLCYFGAFVLLGSVNNGASPSRAVSAIKLVLWYLPILVEITSHFVAFHVPGFVKYSTESIDARSGTVFLIILGAGLDKITGGFKAIVGNAGLGFDGIPVFVAASVIFLGFFSLYFATPGSKRELGNKRALTWFFSQFFFLSALIVTLQGLYHHPRCLTV